MKPITPNKDIPNIVENIMDHTKRPYLDNARKDIERALDNIQEHMVHRCKDNPGGQSLLGESCKKLMEAMWWTDYFRHQADKEYEQRGAGNNVEGEDIKNS